MDLDRLYGIRLLLGGITCEMLIEVFVVLGLAGDVVASGEEADPGKGFSQITILTTNLITENKQ